MKKILFIASAILILLSGCENFLDSELLTEKTTANFPETEKDAQEMVTAIYAHLLFESPETSSQYYIAQLAGDDCLGGNLSYSNNCATNFLMYSGNLNTFAGIWDRCYTLINRANNAINTMENVKSWSSESERNRLFGESYFLRAMAYYELAQVFGGVPLRTTLESTNLPRASVDEIYTQIAADLKNAIEMMPAKIYPKGSDMTGHATKYAAEAMMARVFLFYTGRYEKNELPNGTTKEEVISWIDDCVNNSGHKLVSDQRNIWAYTNDATEDNTEGFRYQYVINHNLKWEGTVSYELGLDYGFFKNNRISGTLEFYKKKTKDLLYRYTLSPGIGLPSANVNFAAIENRGIDFDINAKIINTRNLSWSFSFNISKNLNKVTGLDSKYVSSPGSPALNNTVIEEGKSVGLFYGYKSDGIFQNWEEIEACEALNPEMPYQQKFRSDVLSPGDIKLLDLSNDGYVNFTANNYEDKTVLGSSLPDFSGGFSTRLTYKGFTFSMSGTFSYGNMKSWDAEGRQFQFNAARPKNLLDIALKRWTPENPTNDYPKIRLNGTNYGMTDFWLHDASYLKINNISLTYQLPAKWLRRTGFVDRAELFGSITNVYTFTSYPGPNPESFNRNDKIAGAAVDYTAYPQTRTYNIGIKLSIK